MPHQINDIGLVNDVKLHTGRFARFPHFILLAIEIIKQLIRRVNNPAIANKRIHQAHALANGNGNQIEFTIGAPLDAFNFLAKVNLSQAPASLHLPNSHCPVVTARDQELARLVD